MIADIKDSSQFSRREAADPFSDRIGKQIALALGSLCLRIQLFSFNRDNIDTL